MKLRIYTELLRVIAALRPTIEKIGRNDADLARQMRRALSSTALNLCEGYRGRGKSRNARYQLSLGSASESLSCIEVAEALGYVERVDPAVLDGLDKVIATLVKLSRS